MRRFKRSRLLIPACCAAVSFSCKGTEVPLNTENPFDTRLTVGRDESTAWFSRIKVARFGNDGRITALDAAAPFVRQYNGADGTELRRFLSRGGGPGEARSPITLASVGNGIAVGEGPRVHLFDSIGAYVLTYRLPAPAVALSAGCAPNELAVYGAGASLDNGLVEWLTVYEVADSGVRRMRAVFTDTVQAARRGFGKRVLASDGQRLAFLHEYAAEPFIVLHDCRSRRNTRVPVPELAGRQSSERQGQGTRRVLTTADASFFGIAVIDDGVAWVLSRLSGEPARDGESPGIQDVFLWDGVQGARHVYRTRTGFTLLDGRGDTLLLGAHEPVPHLWIVRAATLSDPRSE